MKVSELMTRDPVLCHPEDTMAGAARLMWEADCGCVPVVDDGRVVGIITDRDITMAAYTRNRPLEGMPVRQAMATDVRVCHADDDLDVALRTLGEAQLHRLPVVDEHDRPIGLLSLANVLQAVGQGPRAGRGELAGGALATLRDVTRPRTPARPRRAAMTVVPAALPAHA